MPSGYGSEDFAVIAGERTKLQIAHFKLSYSRAFVLRAYPLQTHEMLFRKGVRFNYSSSTNKNSPSASR